MFLESIFSLPSEFVPYHARHSTLKEQLIHFCETYCPGLTTDEMFDRIEKGREIELAFTENGLEDITPSIDAAAVNFIWWLTAKAAHYGDLHLQGAFRHDQGEIVFEFLKRCAGKNLYVRVSSHLNENIPLVEKSKGKVFSRQYGFDVVENILPSGKHSFLLAMQPDDSLFIKLEEHGLPPFWNWNFCKTSNVYTCALHCRDWWYSYNRNDFGEGMRDCREGTMGNLKERFKLVLEEIYCHANEISQKKLIETITKGHQFGLSMMHKILTEESSVETHSITTLVNDLKIVIERARTRGYTGQIKGFEVPLPPLGHFHHIPKFL